MLLETIGSAQRNGRMVLFFRIWGGKSNNSNLSVIGVQVLGPLLLFPVLADHNDGLSASLLAQQLQQTSKVLKSMNRGFFSLVFARLVSNLTMATQGQCSHCEAPRHYKMFVLFHGFEWYKCV